MSEINLNNKEYYNNRELSWLDFNFRVLQEADDESNPLLERLKFIAITSSNLDEFFMVRVAGLQDQVKAGFNEPENKAQMTPTEQLEQITIRNQRNCSYQYELYDQLMEELKSYQVEIKRPDELSEAQLEELKQYFLNEVLPTLTPLGIDAYRPFPKLQNKKINIFVNLVQDGFEKEAIVQVPTVLNRFISVNDEEKKIFVLLEDTIRHFITYLFRGYDIDRTFAFRITRNADLSIHEEGAQDLLIEVERFLKERKSGAAVRLEIDIRDNPTINGSFLMNELEIHEGDVYRLNGPLDLTMLFGFTGMLSKELPQLTFEPFTPSEPESLKGQNIFEKALKEDLFFHHPYESFKPIVQFIQEAAKDKETMAIKQTLYRVSDESPIIQALKEAAEAGKQVTVLVELKARFDEENNVQWAKTLEDAGCHVIYGMNNLKTHSKITLVVKRVNNKLVRFIHLGTGNYNDSTAKLYTDMGLITTHPGIGEDAMNFFNYLSGYSTRPDYNHLYVAPFEIRDAFGELIDQEIEYQKQHGNGRIIAKMNSLTDKKIIMKLYEASQAGVKVDLVVRGICCLRPGIEGVSENIRVLSIVGRFLEHSRIYYFHQNGEGNMYLSSADMMTRNMIKRVEILFPIYDESIKSRLLDIMDIELNDNKKARIQQSNGEYVYVDNDQEPLSSQQALMDRARQANIKMNPYKDSLLTKIKDRFRK